MQGSRLDFKNENPEMYAFLIEKKKRDITLSNSKEHHQKQHKNSH